jgi:hypothetical protein
MNDLDQLRTLRDDVPADPAALARARRLLMERAAPSQRARHRQYSRRAVLATGAVAASAVGAVVIAGLPIFDDSPTGASPAAAAALNEAANNAERAAPVRARAGQHVYTRTHEWVLFGVTYSSRKVPEGTPVDTDRIAYYLSENVHEVWRPVGNSQFTLIRKTEGLRRKPLRPSDVQNLKDAGVDINRKPDKWFSPDPRNPKDQPEPPLSDADKADPFVNPTPATLATLPRDPGKLLDRVRKHAGSAGPSRDGQALDVIAGLLRQADALIEPALRAALFRAAARIPGIERWSTRVNLDGQVGVAIGRAEAVNGTRQEIIVDLSTARVIGERSVQVSVPRPTEGPLTDLADIIPVGTVTGLTATRSVIVDRSGQTTPAR